MARWKYKDAIGIEREGVYQGCSDFGGTDIVYRFYRDDGTLDCVSGSRLKAAERLWNVCDDGTPIQPPPKQEQRQ